MSRSRIHPSDKYNARAWLCGGDFSQGIALEQRASEAHSGEHNFFAPDFALSFAKPWFYGEPIATDFTPQPLPTLVTKMGSGRDEFVQLHQDILGRIHRGVLRKVVPIVCEYLHFAEPLTAAMFTPMWPDQEFPHQYVYGFEALGEGLCGVTPELLFSVNNGILRTMALAGTGRCDGPPLLDNKKECLEHQLVIEHIVTELRRWGQAVVGVTEEKIYGALKHLHTPIELRLQNRPTFSELVVALHPTAALGGWPRQPAMQWLTEQNFHLQRARFGAPFGYVNPDASIMYCVVAIRGVQWWQHKALLAVGCGVVDGSESSLEWAELELKRRATCDLLGLPI